MAWLAEREVHEPQLVFDDAGTLLLVWRETSDAGSDLFIARRDNDGSFEPPVRINDDEATVESFPHDEMRAAVATGQNGRVAVAWADKRGQVRAAVSADRARSFAPSIQLEQTDAAAYRGFPALAFGASGALHAIWIDSRHAEGFAEEPADLFYAIVNEGTATESNLTAHQDATVCGCCRTHLEAGEDGSVRGLFRNADEEGYRDIFTVFGQESGGLASPERIGQPLWELQGCPMSGPVSVAGRVLWPDGSSGKKILMEAGFSTDPAKPLFSADARGDWVPRLSPRSVASARPDSTHVLLPGRPSTRLIARSADEDSWTLVADDLPAWATSAAHQQDHLILVGAVEGELRRALRRLDS